MAILDEMKEFRHSMQTEMNLIKSRLDEVIDKCTMIEKRELSSRKI